MSFSGYLFIATQQLSNINVSYQSSAFFPPSFKSWGLGGKKQNYSQLASTNKCLYLVCEFKQNAKGAVMKSVKVSVE